MQNMQAYIRGEERAFEALFRKYAPMLSGYFVRRGQSTSDIEDLVQQTDRSYHRERYKSAGPRLVGADSHETV